uniref:2,3-bisphosphoglycerate-independent phosphoglycerate mutase n=1 Tax=Gelidium kathyanniae TaxID=2483893 RepID=A0A3G2QY75_9FLOR|nr:phosphoglycerate mutase [Gelidium kathyanniae]AYO27919.1 phosphoglycerate mutase [Gelidium kathyanniae]
MNNQSIKPIILTILDGWGHSHDRKGNAIKKANTPTLDKLLENFSHTLLNASGKYVGLPDEQMGNSEVGHTTIGGGRVVNQDLVRINKAISDDTFSQNTVLNEISTTKYSQHSKLHLIGLCSDGGVHSHINHLIELIHMLHNKNHNICIHIIVDGRDTEAYSAKNYIKSIIKEIENYNNINICTVSGRYYSMDRDCRWLRTEKAYKVLTEDSIKKTSCAIATIDKYYAEGISDEFIPPTRISKGKISNNDSIIFFNFRPDRMRQLLHTFAEPHFKGFTTKTIKNLRIVTFTQYDSNIKIPIVFPSESSSNFLGEIISNNGFKQFRLAETEKYAHVTYFFNGGIEEPFPGEDRELIPSPLVETYDLEPKMSAQKITERVIEAINRKIYQFIVINYANPDMVGHTGNIEATIEAIETVDLCIKQLVFHAQKHNTTVIITADHGNAELMLTQDNKPCKSHSTNPVPFILIENENNYQRRLRTNGSLADIAPTILELLEIKAPELMNGKSLLNKNYQSYN